MDSIETIKNVLNMIENGVDKTEIAEKYGVSVRFVENLIEANNKKMLLKKTVIRILTGCLNHMMTVGLFCRNFQIKLMI